MYSKKNLLNNICKGNTWLKAGGRGLEELVKELFECEGYYARICSKRAVRGVGDIDIEAIKSDRFSETKIFAQVKHHDGISEDWGVQQLEAVKNQIEIQYSIFIFITSAEASEKAKKHAENAGIKVLDGAELVDWIYDNIEKLSSETLHSLRISNLPQIID